HRPPGAESLPQGLHQVLAEEYRNPAALPPGNVLIVGSGQTGCQLAEELHQAAEECSLPAAGAHGCHAGLAVGTSFGGSGKPVSSIAPPTSSRHRRRVSSAIRRPRATTAATTSTTALFMPPGSSCSVDSWERKAQCFAS